MMYNITLMYLHSCIYCSIYKVWSVIDIKKIKSIRNTNESTILVAPLMSHHHAMPAGCYLAELPSLNIDWERNWLFDSVYTIE